MKFIFLLILYSPKTNPFLQCSEACIFFRNPKFGQFIQEFGYVGMGILDLDFTIFSNCFLVNFLLYVPFVVSFSKFTSYEIFYCYD